MKLLDVYYHIDVQKTHDITFIEKGLEIYIRAKCREYSINKFLSYDMALIKENNTIEKENEMTNNNKTELTTQNEINNTEVENEDVIKNGLNKFNEMFNKLKLKTANEVWFFYITNGNIGDKYKNVSVILLNKCPMIKKANYVINKTQIDVNINYTKAEKLKGTKCLTNNLNHLFKSQKTIDYI